MASSSSRTKAAAESSTQVGGDLLTKKKLARADFNKKQPICEVMVDLEELDQAYPGIMAMFEVQGWVSAMSRQQEVVSPYALREFCYNMDRVNKYHITSKVGTSKFVLKTSQIAEYLQVTEDGDERYLDNIRSEQFFAAVSKEELNGVVFQPGAPFKNPMHASDLTPMAYVVWQIMLSNVLPQTGHTTELSYFAIYTLYGILSGRKINLPMLMLNHSFRCRNQKRASIPYARMITALLQRSSVKIKSSEVYHSQVKHININTFICRNVLRGDGDTYTYLETKKRRIDEQAPPPASTSNAPTAHEEDPFAYLDDIDLSPSHDGRQGNETGTGGVTLDTISQQLSDMHWSIQRINSRQDRLLTNQELLVRDLATHFNFDVDMSKYHFGSPHGSPPHE